MILIFILLNLFIPYPGSTSGTAEVIKLQDLSKISAKSESGIKVINFWATWCGPCVKELPALEAINTAGTAEVIFVSLDFVKDLSKVNSMIEKKNIQSKVYLLNETNYDILIPTISPDWSGAIPATLLIDSKGRKHFYEKPFTQQELEELIRFYTPK